MATLCKKMCGQDLSTVAQRGQCGHTGTIPSVWIRAVLPILLSTRKLFAMISTYKLQITFLLPTMLFYVLWDLCAKINSSVSRWRRHLLKVEKLLLQQCSFEVIKYQFYKKIKMW